MSDGGAVAAPSAVAWGTHSRSADERLFLQGPRSRRSELRTAWRIFWECVRGFRALHFYGPCVTVFGSARYDESHPAYAVARGVGRGLAEAGFTVMTGGGPGLMEAANRGAREAGGRSIGANIRLAHEQQPNAYLDRWIEFRYFFVRKLLLLKYSYAFIVMPGGFGTLDELFETAVLVQTGKMKDFPLVLMGRAHWANLLAHVRDLVALGAIDPADAARLLVADTAEEAVALVRDRAIAQFGLTYGPRMRRRWYLFE